MKRLGVLQVLRAVAALSVALLHFQSDAEKFAIEAGRKFTAILTDYLGSGVDLFFVISGFVMVYASRDLFARPGGASEFLGRRIARIVPLYWVVTTLFVGVLLVSPSVLSTRGVTLVEVVKSYFFVPYQAGGTGLLQPVYKLGWTLNYEMTFYVVFALFMFLPMRRALAAVSLTLGALVLSGAMLAPEPGALAFWSNPIVLEFVFGMGIALAYIEGVRLPLWGAVLAVALGAAGVAVSPTWGFNPEGHARFLMWGLPAAAILAGTLLVRRIESEPGEMSLAVRCLEKLGDASYAIYLVHPLIIRGLRVAWTKAGLADKVSPWVFVLVGLAILIPISILIYEHFEKPLTKAAKAAQARLAASPDRPLHPRAARARS